MPGNKIEIDPRYCKGCGLCTTACPHKLIALATELNEQGFYPARISAENLQRCTGCALCARLCPDCAISVYKSNIEQQRSTDA